MSGVNARSPSAEAISSPRLPRRFFRRRRASTLNTTTSPRSALSWDSSTPVNLQETSASPCEYSNSLSSFPNPIADETNDNANSTSCQYQPFHSTLSNVAGASRGVPATSLGEESSPLDTFPPFLDEHLNQYDIGILGAPPVGAKNPSGTALGHHSRSAQKCLSILEKLGALHALYEYFHDYRKGIPDGFKALDNGDELKQLEKSAPLASYAIEKAARDKLAAIIKISQKGPLADEEFILLKALEAIRRFEAVATRGVMDKSKRAHSTILRRLLVFSQARDDSIDVGHRQKELSFLARLSEEPQSLETNRLIAESFQRSAQLACDVIGDLELDDNDRKVLQFTDQNLLPVAHRALHDGFDEVARILYETQIVESEPLDVLGRTLAHAAVEGDHLKILDFLLKRDTSLVPRIVEQRDLFSRTPLLTAASNARDSAFDILVQAGADLRCQDLASRSLLNHASASGSVGIVRHMLESGVEANYDTFGLASPLIEAAARGYYPICLLLLEARPHWYRVDRDTNFNDLDDAAAAALNNGHHQLATLIKQHHLRFQQNQSLNLLRGSPSSRFTPPGFSQQLNYSPNNTVIYGDEILMGIDSFSSTSTRQPATDMVEGIDPRSSSPASSESFSYLGIESDFL